jgi:hypothetical protein
VQSEILEKQRDAKVKIYAIWFRNLPADFRFTWPSAVLDDPRVTNLWDSQKSAGNWYASNLTQRRSGPEWDTWIVYPAGRAFADSQMAWGHPIITSRERLRSELEKARQQSTQGSHREIASRTLHLKLKGAVLAFNGTNERRRCGIRNFADSRLSSFKTSWPRASIKLHHPGDACAYVQQGSMVLVPRGKTPVTMDQGQTGCVEPWAVDDDKNASQTAPVKFLVFFVT